MTYSYIMGRILLTLLFITCLSVRVFAQGNDSSVGNEFKDFREELQNEYVDFRKEINAEYIEFLSRAWKEYRLFQGRTPDETPKPLSPVLSQEEKDCREVLVGTDVGTEQLIDETLAAKEKAERNILKGISTEVNLRQITDSLQLDFFGAELWLHYQSRPFYLPAVTEQSVGNLWREMAGSRFSSLLADMLCYKEKMQMNDWAYFLLVKKVATHLSTLQGEDCRTVFQHFLLVQSGYDVRLARMDRFLVLLVPIHEKVYACSYLEIDGRPYYVISDKDLKSYSSIFTYQLPDNLIQTPYLSLMIYKELLLPMQPKAFCIKTARLEVKGEVNQNKIRFYKEYPSCELAIYARAIPDNELMKQLLASLSVQLAEKPFAEALDQLLLWVQKGFRYQTDREQFGYEKPFFIEENFYYPACDCEDRSILFANLVRRLWGKEVVLLDYPGHVATAVCMGKEEVEGAYISLKGEKYIVCDPTYMNAKAGLLMPSCKAKQPKVIRL